MVVTEFEMVTLVNASSENVSEPMVVTELGMVTLVNALCALEHKEWIKIRTKPAS